ncbi:hypothetical protein V8E54_012645 [Elaphomyces granulatus]
MSTERDPQHLRPPGDLLTAGGEPPRYIPYPSFHKSTIVHIASSQKDSGCPGVEVEVGVPATERDKGDRKLETTDRAGGVDLRRLPYQTVYGVLSCREEVLCLHNGNPVPAFLVYQST